MAYNKPLKRDNAAPEEVVEGKLKELTEILQQLLTKSSGSGGVNYTGKGTWTCEYGIDKNMGLKTNNFMMLGRKIISLAEQSEILQQYTTLNKDFTKRLRDENRFTDEEGIGEKRPKDAENPLTPSESSRQKLLKLIDEARAGKAQKKSDEE
ncbi:hypothetical protein RhiirA1_474654 [Rhizophagus irregularis]|uniref:Uncharacterized protein n=1 Tax=Rhizophagus irregularis TaxID=588596 RepID=A0A2N0QY78_9GLOM|nr:hypothetical protein RhiirA1_474654 [Rhizophagus irregularis]